MQIQLNKAKEIFLKIYDDKILAEEIEKFVLENVKNIEKYLKKGLNKNWKSLLKKDGFVKLCVCVAYLPIVKEKYEKKGISDEVFFDTMTDIKIWIDDAKLYTGKAGIDEFNWIVNHLNLEIFKLGRLQFQLSNYYFGLSYSNKDIKIKFKEKCLNIHIPRGESMKNEDCEQSIQLAKAFFSKFYSEYPTNYFICHSWLLYEGNKNFVKEDSNIMKFVKHFDVVGNTNFPSQTFRWLFGVVESDIKLLANKAKNGHYYDYDKMPCATTLQQNAIKYLKDGGKFGDAKGVWIN